MKHLVPFRTEDGNVETVNINLISRILYDADNPDYITFVVETAHVTVPLNEYNKKGLDYLDNNCIWKRTPTDTSYDSITIKSNKPYMSPI